MSTATRPHGAYEADPTPYLGMLAIAAGLFVSAPALIVGMGLAPIARRAMVAFVALTAAGAAWVWLWWARIETEMHRAQGTGERHGMFTQPGESLQAAWPHIRMWWLLAAPLCFAVAAGHRRLPPAVGRGAARAQRAPRRACPPAGRAQGAPRPLDCRTGRPASGSSSSAVTSPATPC